MNEENTNRGGWDASDLREKLNGEILERFPIKIIKKMLGFANGDMLRLPTEKEIFGVNEYGETEDESVEQFDPMKLRKNRIALQGHNGTWGWYWLANGQKDFRPCFTYVGSIGDIRYINASVTCGVRLVFKLKHS